MKYLLAPVCLVVGFAIAFLGQSNALSNRYEFNIEVPDIVYQAPGTGGQSSGIASCGG